MILKYITLLLIVVFSAAQAQENENAAEKSQIDKSPIEEMTITKTQLFRSIDNELARPIVSLDFADQALSITNVSALTTNQPGINSSSYGNFTGGITIRGLGIPRVQISLDGASLPSMGYTGGDHPNLVNPLSIERTDVYLGPASIVFGNGSIGGVMDIVSRTITPGENFLNYTVATGYEDNSNQRHVLARVEASTKKIGWSLSANTLEANNYNSKNADVHALNADVANSDGKLENIAANLFFNVNDNTSLSLNVGMDDSVFGVPGHAHHEEEHHEEEEEHVARVYSDNESKFLKLTHKQTVRDSERFGLHIENFVQTSEYKLQEIEQEEGMPATTGLNLMADKLQILSKQELRLSSLNFALQQSWQTTDYSLLGEESLLTAPVEISSWHIGGLVEYPLRNNLILSFGAKIAEDSYESGARAHSFSPTSYSFGIKHIPMERLNYSVSYTAAERAPTEFELYSAGLHQATDRFEIGSTNLQTEQVSAFDSELNIKFSKFEMFVRYYNYEYSNYIYLSASPEPHNFAGITIPAGEEVYVYTGSDADIQGIEVGGKYKIANNISAKFWLDRIRGRLSDNSYIPLLPAQRVNVSVDYQINSNWSLNAGATRYSSQDNIAAGETVSPASTVINIATSFQTLSNANKFKLSFGVKNALNDDVRLHSSPVKDEVPASGRAYYMNFEYSMQRGASL